VILKFRGTSASVRSTLGIEREKRKSLQLTSILMLQTSHAMPEGRENLVLRIEWAMD
jgi:hypothetical protein